MAKGDRPDETMINIRIKKADVEKLKHLADQQDRTVPGYIRHLLRQVLEAEEASKT